jgi:hypothetical protein
MDDMPEQHKLVQIEEGYVNWEAANLILLVV